MATNNVNFKIKNGLIVEGTTGTINGADILTKNTDSDNYIIGLVGGVAYITSVSGNLDVTDGVLTIDESGLVSSIAGSYLYSDGSGNLAVDTEGLYDAGFVDTSGSQTLTNKTIDGVKLTGTVAFKDGSDNDYLTVSQSYTGTARIVAADDLALRATNDIILYPGNDSGPTGKAYIHWGDDAANAFPEREIATHGYVDGLASNYEASGAVSTHAALTSTHGVSGDIVGTTDTQTLSNKSFSDSVTLTGSGDFAINGNSNIVLTPGSGQSVKWGSDILATQTYADTAVSDHNDLTTGVHGVTGNVVGTSDSQVLTNKTINDELYFTNPSTQANDGGIKINDLSEDFEIVAYTANLHLTANNDLTVTSNGGDIVLDADGASYLTSVSAGNEIATHSYVDNAVSGLTWKQAVNLLSVGNLDISGSLTGVAVDGHPVFDGTDAGYRILLTGQTNPTENGIYLLEWDGVDITAVRAADADTVAELVGAAVFVMEGSTYGGSSWVQNNHYVEDYSDLVWTQFSGGGTITAGSGITVDGLEVSINRTAVDTWYELDGTVSTHSGLTTGVHGVTGDVVGTSDAQTLTNKTISYADNTLTVQVANISDLTATATELNYVDGVTSSVQDQLDSKAAASNPTLTGSLTLDGTGDFTISADAGIVLDATTASYIGSATSTNEIATKGYVDNAVDNVTIDLSTAAGANIDWNSGSSQFDVNVTDVITNGGIATESYVSSNYVSSTSLDTEVGGLGYAKTADLPTDTDDISEAVGATNLYFTDQRVLDAVSGSDITPNTVTIDTYRKEEATQQYVANASTVNVHTLPSGFESAKYLVRVVSQPGGVKQSQLTEILLTADGNNNVAITEYGTIHTSNNPFASFSATNVNGVVTLTATTEINSCEIIAAATMLSWAD